MNELYDVAVEIAALRARPPRSRTSSPRRWTPSRRRSLLRDLEAHVRLTPTAATVDENLGDEYAPVLDSSATTTAMVLRALVAIDRQHPLACASRARPTRGARSRQVAHDAGSGVGTPRARQLQKDEPRRRLPDFDARVWVGGKPRARRPVSRAPECSARRRCPWRRCWRTRAKVAFQVEGTGELFYEARLRYARKEAPSDVLDRGFFVRKMVRGVSPEASLMRSRPCRRRARRSTGRRAILRWSTSSSSRRRRASRSWSTTHCPRGSRRSTAHSRRRRPWRV